jgi:hypothetical protein
MKKAISTLTTVGFILLFLSAGCRSNRTPTPRPIPPAATPSASATQTVRVTATRVTLVNTDPFNGIVATIEASDPISSIYDPNSAAYAAFPQAVKQLASLNAPENDGASMLAYALNFPRPDSCHSTNKAGRAGKSRLLAQTGCKIKHREGLPVREQ